MLKSRGMFTEAKWYWIGVGALFGYVIVFNILFTIALGYLKRNSKILQQNSSRILLKHMILNYIQIMQHREKLSKFFQRKHWRKSTPISPEKRSMIQETLHLQVRSHFEHGHGNMSFGECHLKGQIVQDKLPTQGEMLHQVRQARTGEEWCSLSRRLLLPSTTSDTLSTCLR